MNRVSTPPVASGQDYFSEGITEDIIIDLSRYRALDVVARQSSSCFQGTATDVRDIARQLGAHYLLEGSVRKAGTGIRITAQLMDGSTARHIWADRYDRQMPNVFSVQDDLVRTLVSTIAGQVEIDTDQKAQAKVTESMDAYDCWLRANHGFDLWTRSGNLASKQLLEQALLRDPHFARAHASLAFCHIRAAILSPGSAEIPVLHQAALHRAEQAVRLDPVEARAHNALGWSLMYLRAFDRANAAFVMSERLNPNDGSACIDRALALAFRGEQEAADATAGRAAALNPMGGDWFWSVQAFVHFLGHRHAAAERCFALASPDWPEVLAWHAANLVCLNETAQASDVMQRALSMFTAMWAGPKPVQTRDFVNWLHFNDMLPDEAWERLLACLHSAGLPIQPA